ncbi:MAG: N-acetyl-D-Glu racemase DgcA [Pseudomonadota bacterium]
MPCGRNRGRGECLPYSRYGESIEGTLDEIESCRHLVEGGADRKALAAKLGPSAARNAIDCALWDLQAKRTGKSVFELAKIEPPKRVVTAFTVSLDTPEAMAKAAREVSDRELLKIKLGGTGDLDRLKAVHDAAPQARLIVDANEGYAPDTLEADLEAMATLGVVLVEQPLPVDRDQALAKMKRAVPVAADESCHASEGLKALTDRYDVVNLKLDKTGGLTEALKCVTEAQRLGLGIMVGCMRGTSLAMAPAMLLAGQAQFVDLDGPFLLAQDREYGLAYEGSTVSLPRSDLWG